MDYLVSKKLDWSLMGWKPSTRGVGLDMVTRRVRAIGIRFSRMGMVGAVLPGIQDASLASGGTGGLSQTSGARYGGK